ncbi:response regulator [Pseudomonas syringae]|uniref:Two component LuxR family transcriptional regulator n=1 Tax=Pseudomonas syringae pv. ribicola TaxID=55398 RepID=A0A3M2VJP1_PSESI|nr:response regulator transcription factor [Pseudomonas syringae group genomosp. 3]RML39519.1 Two component LuxR family transcriptional regulator [Pseudomonas syringae pv. ribicola]
MIPRIIIADDHPAILHGCQVVLLNDSSFAKIQATATSISELFIALENHECDVLIVDYSMPGADMDGLGMLDVLNRRYPNLPVLVLTGEENLGILRLILEAKVHGIIQKNSDILCLPKAVRTVLRRGIYLNESLKKALAESPRSMAGEAQLSPKELEIVRLLASGKSPEDIAEILHRSIKTVSWGKNSAKRKLGIQSDAQLYQYYASLAKFTVEHTG